MPKKYDLFFIFSLVFMVVIGIHLVNHYLLKQDIDNYMNLLGDKISEMLPEEDKNEFEEMFITFVEQVKEEEVPIEDVDKLANRIVKLRREDRVLSASKIKEIFPAIAKVKKVDLFPNDRIHKVDLKWPEIAKELEVAFRLSDSIRVEKNHHSSLNDQIQQQLKIHTEITANIENNYREALVKVKVLKDGIKDAHIQQELRDEMEILWSENENLNKKIIALDEIKKVITVEKERLEREITKIDSTQFLN